MPPAVAHVHSCRQQRRSAPACLQVGPPQRRLQVLTVHVGARALLLHDLEGAKPSLHTKGEQEGGRSASSIEMSGGLACAASRRPRVVPPPPPLPLRHFHLDLHLCLSVLLPPCNGLINQLIN